jgi:aminoglycoside phosphotransferase (APT) family kinase protein
MAYPSVPASVRAWVDSTLGSPVVSAAEQVGGMSPGCATRVTCADGTQAFVKAVGTDLNPDTPTMFRREITVLTMLGSHPLWADLLASYDDGCWVALLLEDVEGSHPDLADDRVMAHLLEATDELTRVIGERVPEPPAPDPHAGGLNDLAATFGTWAGVFDRVADVPADLMPGWVVDRAAELRQRVLSLTDHAFDSVLHWDIRNDNLLVRPSGEIVFVDWGQCGVGPDWLDPLLARLERVDAPWFDASLAGSPALVRAGDDAVTAWLVGFGAFLAWRAHTAVDVNLPTLNAFRRMESARFLAAADRRLNLGRPAPRC